MILDLDVGNTRIKWRCNQWSGALLHEECWEASFVKLPAVPARIRMANVAGSDFGRQLMDWLNQRWGVSVEVAVTGHSAAGVNCGYPDPTQLGVDRWLAILASYHQVCCPKSSNAVVVSAGSAITVDLLKVNGDHLGGYIVPGLEMQRRGLFAGTHAVKVSGQWSSSKMHPGENTTNAVSNGCLKMVVALIEAARNELGNKVPVMLCGGDVSYIKPHLMGDVYIEPELVLDGLAILMP